MEKSSEAEGRVVGRKELWRGGSRVARAHRPRRTETTAARNATQRNGWRGERRKSGSGREPAVAIFFVGCTENLSYRLCLLAGALPILKDTAPLPLPLSSRLVSSGPQPPIVSLGQANRVASSYLSLPSFHLIHRLISYPLSLLSPPILRSACPCPCSCLLARFSTKAEAKATAPLPPEEEERRQSVPVIGPDRRNRAPIPNKASSLGATSMHGRQGTHLTVRSAVILPAPAPPPAASAPSLSLPSSAELLPSLLIWWTTLTIAIISGGVAVH